MLRNVARVLRRSRRGPLLQAESASATPTQAEKLRVEFACPANIILSTKNNEVDMVVVPGSQGDFGIMANHAPTVAQLKPGLLSIHNKTEKDDVVTKYVISGGFAVVNEESLCSITVGEAVSVDEIDEEAARKGLADYEAAMNNAKNDEEKALAQIGFEMHDIMVKAIESKN